MARILEWAGKDRHSVDGPATGTGIFTAIAGSHAGCGALRGHKGEYAPFGPFRKSFRSLPYSKGPTTQSFKIATQLSFGLIEHVRRKDGAVAHCLPCRALPSFLQLQ